MKVTQLCAAITALTCLALAVPASAALIPGHWFVEFQYTLGDAESGVIGNPAADPATDSVGGVNLPLTGGPVYAAGTNSPTAVDFTNAYGPWPTVSTEYYSDPAADYDPTNLANWGLSFDVMVDTLPGANDDQEVALVNLGSFTTPSIQIELFQGKYVLHSPGNVFVETGVPATVGGWDHVEMANINGLMDMEINGTALGLGVLAGDFNPTAGITIGVVFANGVGGVQYARGADAVIDEVTLYSIPEPAGLTILAMGSLLLLAIRRRK